MSEQQLVAPPAQPYVNVDVSAVTAELVAFVERLKSNPAGPPIDVGQIVVSPGFRIFVTITDALDSITDASATRQYMIYLGPGLYEENVVCKPWVFIEGSGPDVTTIRAPLGVTGASNSSIGAVTIDAGITAISCVGAVNFAVGNCVITASDSGGTGPRNYLGVSVDFSASSPTPSSVSISYSTIEATVKDTLSITAGVVAASKSLVLLNYCKKITALHGSTNMGCAAATAAEVRLYDCSISTPVWALRLLDDTAKMTATECAIDGQVSPGVVINKIEAGSAPSDLPPSHGREPHYV